MEVQTEVVVCVEPVKAPAKPVKTFSRECAECGKAFQAKRSFGAYCSSPCRATFNNRRLKRGAELYDFIMSKRFDRVNEAEARSIMDALAMGYREQDKLARGGRPSWQSFREAKDQLSRLPGVADGR